MAGTGDTTRDDKRDLNWYYENVIAMRRFLISLKNELTIYLNLKFRFFKGPVLGVTKIGKTIIDNEKEETIVSAKILDDHPHWKFELCKTVFYPATFVTELSKARVWGNQGAVITQDNIFFDQVSREYNDTGRNHSIFKQRHIVPYTSAKGRIAVLAASGSEVYYHWMMDIVPRIDLLIRSKRFDTIDKVILNYKGLPFQRELLQMLSIPEEKIIPSNDHWNFHLQAQILVVPSFVSPNDCPSEKACLFIRSLFEVHKSSRKPYRKIYIQRAKGRTIVNEPEIISFLTTAGFDIISPEKMTVAEQSTIFSEAKYVVAPHGAGLTNLVFCEPGTKVIDLFSPKWVNPCYWILSSHLGLKYAYLIGDGKRIREGIDPMDKAADIRVDLVKLKTLMSALG